MCRFERPKSWSDTSAQVRTLVRTSSVVTSSTSLLSVFSSRWLRLQLSKERPKVSPHSLSVATQGYGIPTFPP